VVKSRRTLPPFEPESFPVRTADVQDQQLEQYRDWLREQSQARLVDLVMEWIDHARGTLSWCEERERDLCQALESIEWAVARARDRADWNDFTVGAE
jgi:hypothetical protein